MMADVMRRGSFGPEVEALQTRLAALGFYGGSVDGEFGPMTDRAVRLYQDAVHLSADGVVGPKTVTALFGATHEEATPFPALTAFKRAELFGVFPWTPQPAPDTSGHPIRIIGGWEAVNIITVLVPELASVGGCWPKTNAIRMHKSIARQFRAMVKEWAKNGLVDRLLEFDGGFYPRYVRGSRTSLSNHSWGTAFDFNAGWNPLGKRDHGGKGSLRELIPIAHKWGFFWGNDFLARPDPMHIEAALIVDVPDETLLI